MVQELLDKTSGHCEKKWNLIKSRATVTEVLKYCEDNGLMEALNDPKRVFNMDEKGFIMTPKNEVVLARKCQKAVYNRSENDEKECVTALLGGCYRNANTANVCLSTSEYLPTFCFICQQTGASAFLTMDGKHNKRERERDANRVTRWYCAVPILFIFAKFCLR